MTDRQIIAIANQKGGVGKTTTAINLGAALAELGRSVTILDLDPQGNASTGLGIPAHQRQPSSYDLLIGDARVSECIRPTAHPGLSVIPATADLASAELDIADRARRVQLLADALTDPEGTSGKAKPAPYNFFYGPSYSDALRAELTWAAEDWKAKGKPGKPKFVHMGANHPYPNAPKAAGEALATELGFEVLPPLVFALSPGDYSAQCLSLKSSGANYAYLGNTAASNISVMKACKTAGVDVQFLSNVWGMDENAAKTAGDAADGVIFPLRTAVGWGGNAPGMKTVMEISKMSDPSGKVYRPVHYIAAVCSALYMKEALDWAAKNGGATGENVAKGFYQKKDWVPAGMDGVCNPSNWTEKDHRPTTKVDLYRAKVSGATDGDINDLMGKGTIKLEKVKTVELPRKPEWFGW